MRSLQEAIGNELRWQPRGLLSRTHDLVDPQAGDGEPYATLVWRPGFLLGGPAEARSGDGCWTFRRRGLLRGSVTVAAEGGGEPVGELREHWRRAVLRLEDGLVEVKPADRPNPADLSVIESKLEQVLAEIAAFRMHYLRAPLNSLLRIN